MNKTAIAVATAASLSLFAGPLVASDSSSTGASANTGTNPTTGQVESQGNTQAGGSAASMAQTTNDPDFEPNFERLDENRDGELDENELNAFGGTAAGQNMGDAERQKLMGDFDADQSNTLNEEEWRDAGEAYRTEVGIKEDEATQ